MNCSIYDPTLKTPDPNYNKVQVVLRKDSDCNLQKIVYTTTSVTNFNWTYYSGSFSLTPSEVNLGFNRIEFRLTCTPYNYASSNSHAVFLDDFDLHKINTAISSDFKLTGNYQGGTTYIVTAKVDNIPSGSGFWWQVCEIDKITNEVIPNTTLTNPSSWWSTNLLYTNTFPGYCCQSNITTGNGTFYYGHKYKITRGTWGPCAEWNSTTHSIYIGPSTDKNGIVETLKEEIPEPIILVEEILTNNADKCNLNISPNPTNDICNIIIKDENEDKYFLEVYSITGIKIFESSQVIPNKVFEFYVKNYSSGIYLIKVTNATSSYNSKLIINH